MRIAICEDSQLDRELLVGVVDLVDMAMVGYYQRL